MNEAWVCRKFELTESSVFRKPGAKPLNPSHKNSRGMTRNDLDTYAML
jgi:hypothetical protein